ncbi:MAG: nicotinate-nucleotide--dimethylbenzimidazole phosphoribosyltransferase [Chromatiales bacterium]|nr:nicotinate-nucleotide--dimethylbenzimidazole phosphoribosyltransferase [Chromatiales bacterium]
MNEPVKQVNQQAVDAAEAHQLQLTKPPGALGRLEELAIRLSGLQGRIDPSIDKLQITVFAADHGVAESGVSAFPQAVTNQMVANFCSGGAAISVVAKQLGAQLEVVDVGTASEPGELPGLISQRAGAGTANLHHQDAMTKQQLVTALEAGRAAVMRAAESGCQLFIGGDMGIANTTAAAAVACALSDVPGELMAGPGTGLQAEGVQHKAAVINSALSRYSGLADAPLETLRVVGGFEIAALSGAYLSCAQLGVPALVDGFISSAAALAAVHYIPAVADWLFYSHQSAEPGHLMILEQLQAKPLLDLGMRLGEGSGAAVAVPLLQLACQLHNNMATFAQAGVSEA